MLREDFSRAGCAAFQRVRDEECEKNGQEEAVSKEAHQQRDRTV